VEGKRMKCKAKVKEKGKIDEGEVKECGRKDDEM
jgi:hypothetical protein